MLKWKTFLWKAINNGAICANTPTMHGFQTYIHDENCACYKMYKNVVRRQPHKKSQDSRESGLFFIGKREKSAELGMRFRQATSYQSLSRLDLSSTFWWAACAHHTTYIINKHSVLVLSRFIPRSGARGAKWERRYSSSLKMCICSKAVIPTCQRACDIQTNTKQAEKVR